MKIIYLSCTPVSKIVGNKIDPWWFQKKGFEVEYWNMTILNYSEKGINAYFGGAYDYEFVFPIEQTINSRADFEKKLSCVGNDYIIDYLDFGQTNDLWILALFKKYNISYYLSPRSNAIFYQKKSFKRLIISIVQSLIIGDLYKKIYTILLRKVYKYNALYQHPSFVFVSGALGKLQWKHCRSSNYVNVPSPDILWSKTDRIIKEDYCVYIDDSVTYSPDMALFNVVPENKTTVNVNQYKKNISEIFSHIEASLNLKIIVAASGKIRYKSNEIFDGKEIYYYNTNELIQHASLVIAHSSNAILQVLVSKKHMLLLFDDSFIPEKNKKTQAVGEVLNIEPIWSSKFIDFRLDSIDIDINKYEIIVKDYLCSENCNVDYREIIYNCLMNHTQD